MPAISFIIPVRNEQRWIATTLTTLRAHVPASLGYEIIVVDNGSTDNTCDIVNEHGVDLLLNMCGTVAAVRNAGVQHAASNVLVFLDGDVMLTPAWHDNIAATVAQLTVNPQLVTGSTVRVPCNSTWIERHWFARQQQRSHTHINSGHLITSRILFQQLGGFAENLETGEDYDFCVRARKHGAAVFNDTALPAIHEGFPKTVRHFFRRELWHGKGDFASLRTFSESRIAQLGTAFLHAQLLAIIYWILSGNWRIPAFTIATCLLCSILIASWRFRPLGPAGKALNGVLYYLYFLARGLSLYATLLGTPVRGAGRGERPDSGRNGR